MVSDVMVLEDSEEYLYVLTRLVERQNLTPRAFRDPRDALAHLESRATAPLGYLVDMRNIHHLPGPEALYHAAVAKGWGEGFYFVTSRYSAHDDIVARRTGARVLGKHDIDGIDTVIQEMRRSVAPGLSDTQAQAAYA